jgi:MFS family permease
MADHYYHKHMLVFGMLLQGVAIIGIGYTENYTGLIGLAAVLGFGTALVYPTFLAAIADATHPKQRAESIGVFRLWRDLGYAVGALLSGVIAEFYGLAPAILSIGILTILSGLLIQIRMPR